MKQTILVKTSMKYKLPSTIARISVPRIPMGSPVVAALLAGAIAFGAGVAVGAAVGVGIGLFLGRARRQVDGDILGATVELELIFDVSV